MVTTATSKVLDEFVEQLTARRTVHHAVAAVESHDRSLRLATAAGRARPDGSPMRPETPFHYASVTKLFTTTVVMQLWEQDRLELDSPITGYLPREHTDGIHELNGVDHSGSITVRHLLSHTSGLADYFLDTPSGDASFTDLLQQGGVAYDLDDVLARVRRLTPYFPPQDPAAPRRRARYSDTNYQLLGAVVAAVTDRSYQEAVEAQILAPLALHDTWFAGRPRSGTPQLPAAIWSGTDVLDAPQAMASMAPEGGLIGTTADALTFLRALIGGELFERHGTLETMQEGWTRFDLPRDRSAIMAPGWPIEYGLGIKRFRLPRLLNAGRRAPTLIGHTGASGSWLFWCPEHELYLAGTVDQTTAAGLPYQRLPRAIRRLHSSLRSEVSAP